MKPRKNYRTRPKKTGAKKKQRVRSQERKLEALGYKREKLDKMTTVEVRDLLKKAMKKKQKPVKKKKAAAKKKTAKKK